MQTVNDNYPKKSEMSDEDLKQLALQQYQSDEIKKSNFPTEIISLPSRGVLYPESSLLHEGKIEMKYMTAREEDILTSPNLIKQGIVLDKLMQSLIVSPIKYNDLVIGDKNAIMIAARILGYGKEYQVDVTCPKCSEKTTVNVDLTTLPDQPVSESATMVAPNLFEFTLPNSKRTVLFSLPTHGTEKKIEYELEALKKNQKKDSVNKELTTRLKNLIKSVDGNADERFVAQFVENELFAMDSKALRSYIKEISPDQKMQIDFVCDHCSHEEEALAFNIDTNFFWPKS